MTWVQRLKRVFHIDIETCQACGGPVRIFACMEDPVVMPKALATLAGQALKKIPDYLKGEGRMPGRGSVTREPRPATNDLI